MKAIALIDGEHYLPVNQAALEYLHTEKKYDVVGAIFIGGTEKIGSMDDLKQLNIPVIWGKDVSESILKAITLYQPDTMVDLSDEPVVGYQERFELANLILSQDVIYEGSDFRFTPPYYFDICQKPSISIIGTGKRIGKTAIGAYTGRLLNGDEGISTDFNPCIVTMGRGGPAEPEVLEGELLQMTPQFFLTASQTGKHAASDHYEDALLSRLTTIGCRRCGGGFSGEVYTSTVPEGAKIANQLPHDFVIFEGSGASIPPIKTNGWLLCVGAHQPIDYIGRYMGPYRVKKSNVVLMTMCEEPMASPEKIIEITRFIQYLNPDAKIVQTVFRPKPLTTIENKRVLYATTAPEKMKLTLEQYLQNHYQCEVVGSSHSLSNRPKLRQELNEIFEEKQVDTILVEVKAAAIDVVTQFGVEKGIEVVYADNIPQQISGNEQNLPQVILDLAENARKQFSEKK